MRQLIEVGALGGLLLLALVGAYLVYFESDTDKGDDGKGVAVYVASQDEVSSVSFTSKATDVAIDKKTDAAGEYLWVTVTKRTETTPEPPVARVTDTDGDTDAIVEPPAPEPVVEEEVTAFVGNDEARKLLEEFAPFKAERQLGNASGQDFGFDEPFATIEVKRAGEPVTMTIGDATYGERSRYLRSGDDVYLVAKRMLTKLSSADRSLPERRLSPLRGSEVKQLVVQAGDRSRTLVHANADDKVKAFWADAATPETKDAVATGWADVAVALTAREYIADAPEGLSPVATLSLTGPSEDWSIEVLSGGEPPKHYARTGFNRGLVELTASQAEDLVGELEAVLNPSSDE